MGANKSICCTSEGETKKRDKGKRKKRAENSHYSTMSFKERHLKESMNQANNKKNKSPHQIRDKMGLASENNNNNNFNNRETQFDEINGNNNNYNDNYDDNQNYQGNHFSNKNSKKKKMSENYDDLEEAQGEYLQEIIEDQSEMQPSRKQISMNMNDYSMFKSLRNKDLEESQVQEDDLLEKINKQEQLKQQEKIENQEKKDQQNKNDTDSQKQEKFQNMLNEISIQSNKAESESLNQLMNENNQENQEQNKNQKQEQEEEEIKVEETENFDEEVQEQTPNYDGVIDEVVDLDIDFKIEAKILNEYYEYKFKESGGHWNGVKNFFQDLKDEFEKIQNALTEEEKVQEIKQFQEYITSIFQSYFLSPELNKIYDFKRIELLEVTQTQIIFQTYRHKLPLSPRILKFSNFDTIESVGELQILDIMYNEMIKYVNKPCLYTYNKMLIQHNSNTFLIIEQDKPTQNLQQFMGEVNPNDSNFVELQVQEVLKIFKDIILFIGLLHKHNITLKSISPEKIYYIQELDQWIMNDFRQIFKYENCEDQSLAKVELEENLNVDEKLLETTQNAEGQNIKIYNPFLQNSTSIGKIFKQLIDLSDIRETFQINDSYQNCIFPLKFDLQKLTIPRSSFINSVQILTIIQNQQVNLLNLYNCLNNFDFSTLFKTKSQMEQEENEYQQYKELKQAEKLRKQQEQEELDDEQQEQEQNQNTEIQENPDNKQTDENPINPENNQINENQENQEDNDKNNENNENLIKNLKNSENSENYQISSDSEDQDSDYPQSAYISIFNLVLPNSTVQAYYDDRYQSWFLQCNFPKMKQKTIEKQIKRNKSLENTHIQKINVNRESGVTFIMKNQGTINFQDYSVLSYINTENMKIESATLELFISRPKITPVPILEKFVSIMQICEKTELQIQSEKILGDGLNLLNIIVKNMNKFKFSALVFSSEKALDYLLSKSASIRVEEIRVNFDNDIQLPLLNMIKQFKQVKRLKFSGSHLIQDKNWWANWNTVGIFTNLNSSLDYVKYTINPKFINKSNTYLKPEELTKLYNIVQNLTHFQILDERFSQAIIYKQSLNNLKSIKLLDHTHLQQFLLINPASQAKNSLSNVESLHFCSNTIYEKKFIISRICPHEKKPLVTNSFVCVGCLQKFGNLQKVQAHQCATCNTITCDQCLKSEKAYEDIKNQNVQEWIEKFQKLKTIYFDFTIINEQAKKQLQNISTQNSKSILNSTQISTNMSQYGTSTQSQLYQNIQKYTNSQLPTQNASIVSQNLNPSQIVNPNQSQIQQSVLQQPNQSELNQLTSVITQTVIDPEQEEKEFNLWWIDILLTCFKKEKTLQEKGIQIKIRGAEKPNEIIEKILQIIEENRQDFPEQLLLSNYFAFLKKKNIQNQKFLTELKNNTLNEIENYKKEQKQAHELGAFTGLENQLLENYKIKTFELKDKLKQIIPKKDKILQKQFSEMLMKKIVEIPLPKIKQKNSSKQQQQLSKNRQKLSNIYQQSFFQSVQAEEMFLKSAEKIKISQSGNFVVQDLLKLDFLQKFKTLKSLTLTNFNDQAFPDILVNILQHEGTYEVLEKLKLTNCYLTYNEYYPKKFSSLKKLQLKMPDSVKAQENAENNNLTEEENELFNAPNPFQYDYLEPFLQINLKVIRLQNLIPLNQELKGAYKFLGENILNLISQNCPSLQELVLFGGGTFNNLDKLTNFQNLTHLEIQTNQTQEKAYYQFFFELQEQNQLEIISFKNCVNFNDEALEALVENNQKLQKNLKILAILNGDNITGKQVKKHFIQNEKPVFENLEQLIFESEQFREKDFASLKPLQKQLKIQFQNFNLKEQFVLSYLLKQPKPEENNNININNNIQTQQSTNQNTQNTSQTQAQQNTNNNNTNNNQNNNQNNIHNNINNSINNLQQPPVYETLLNKKLREQREKNIARNVKLIGQIIGESDITHAGVCTELCDSGIEEIILEIINRKLAEIEDEEGSSFVDQDQQPLEPDFFVKQLQNLDRHLENTLTQRDPEYVKKLYKIAKFYDERNMLDAALKNYIKCDGIIFYTNHNIPPIFDLDAAIGNIFIKQNQIEDGIFCVAISIGMYINKRIQQNGNINDKDQQELDELEEIINQQLDKLDYFKLLDILQEKYEQVERELVEGLPNSDKNGSKKKKYLLLAINYLMQKYEQLKMFDLNCIVLSKINETFFSKQNYSSYTNRIRADHCTQLIPILKSNKNCPVQALAYSILKQVVNYEQMAFEKSFEFQENFINKFLQNQNQNQSLENTNNNNKEKDSILGFYEQKSKLILDTFIEEYKQYELGQIDILQQILTLKKTDLEKLSLNIQNTEKEKNNEIQQNDESDPKFKNFFSSLQNYLQKILEKESEKIHNFKTKENLQQSEQELLKFNFFFFENYLHILRFRALILQMLVNFYHNNTVNFEDNFIDLETLLDKLETNHYLKNNKYIGYAYYLKSLKLTKNQPQQAFEYLSKALEMDLNEILYKNIFEQYIKVKEILKQLEIKKKEEDLNAKISKDNTWKTFHEQRKLEIIQENQNEEED